MQALGKKPWKKKKTMFNLTFFRSQVGSVNKVSP